MSQHKLILFDERKSFIAATCVHVTHILLCKKFGKKTPNNPYPLQVTSSLFNNKQFAIAILRAQQASYVAFCYIWNLYNIKIASHAALTDAHWNPAEESGFFLVVLCMRGEKKAQDQQLPQLALPQGENTYGLSKHLFTFAKSRNTTHGAFSSLYLTLFRTHVAV